jgi:hypothetical protein
VKTYRGLFLWERGRIVKILQNPTYTGVRYLNQLAVVHEAPGAVRTTKRKRFVQRNRDEWIGIKVPASRLHSLQSNDRIEPDHGQQGQSQGHSMPMPQSVQHHR